MTTTKRELRFVKPAKAFAMLAVSRSSGYKQLKTGLLPSLVRIGPRARALPEHEIDQMIRARIAGLTDDEIRQLVRRIVAERAGLMRDDLPVEFIQGNDQVGNRDERVRSRLTASEVLPVDHPRKRREAKQ